MIIYVIVLGLLIGSFLNVCIYRLPRHESIVIGSSHCTKCGVPIKWYDLVPVFSYLILRGKCRNCKDKISPQYPIIEFINALMYAVIYYCFKSSILTLILCIMASILIVVFMILFTKRQSV